LTTAAAAGLDQISEDAQTALEDAGETLSEVPDALAGMAEDAAEGFTETVEDAVEAATTEAEEAVEAAAQPLNIFAAPSEQQESVASAEADAEPETEDAAIEEPASPAVVMDDAPEPAEPKAEVAPAETVNIFSAPKEQPSSSSIVNIFAAPAAAAAGAVASMFSKDSTAKAEEAEDEDAQETVEAQVEDTAMEEPALDAQEDPSPVEEAESAPLSSIFAPPPSADKVRDLGSIVADGPPASMFDQTADPVTPEPEPLVLGPEQLVSEQLDAAIAEPEPEPFDAPIEEPIAPEQPVRSIFAPPPQADPVDAPLDDPQAVPAGAFRQPESPEPEPEAEPAPDSSNRFQQLVSLVHGAATMGAPGEGGSSATSETQDPPTDQPLEEPNDLIDADHIARISQSETVADQLAAAAAWLTLMKGQARFTRREVMTVLETIPTDKPRELADRIKGFGKLVRSGVLVLIDDGVFAMAQTDRERFQSLMDRN
ncbi:MAG: hypothetical protein AAGH68_11970, partial [Pseudomonadota bacterium]